MSLGALECTEILRPQRRSQGGQTRRGNGGDSQEVAKLGSALVCGMRYSQSLREGTTSDLCSKHLGEGGGGSHSTSRAADPSQGPSSCQCHWIPRSGKYIMLPAHPPTGRAGQTHQQTLLGHSSAAQGGNYCGYFYSLDGVSERSSDLPKIT